MGQASPAARMRSKSGTDKNVSKKIQLVDKPEGGSDREIFFRDLVRLLWPNKPELALRARTGKSERHCWRMLRRANALAKMVVAGEVLRRLG